PGRWPATRNAFWYVRPFIFRRERRPRRAAAASARQHPAADEPREVSDRLGVARAEVPRHPEDALDGEVEREAHEGGEEPEGRVVARGEDLLAPELGEAL